MSRVEDFVNSVGLGAIIDHIAEAETRTSGEVRVCLLIDLEPEFNSIGAQAEAIFCREGLHKTKDKTGVLILVVFEKHQFKILADSGINAKLGQKYWDNLASSLTWFFRHQLYVDGICLAVSRVGDELAKYFPRAKDDVNELPNEVITKRKEQGQCDSC